MMTYDDSADMDILDFWAERPGASDEPYPIVASTPPAGERGASQGLAVASKKPCDEPTGGFYLHSYGRKDPYAATQDEAR